jgi:hypothetical protein
MLDSPFRLHSSIGSLLGLFLYLYHWTKAHTYVPKKVNLHTLLEIVVKFVSYLLKYHGWPSNNEIGLLLFCKFHFNQSFCCTQCRKCLFCFFFFSFPSFYFLKFVLLPPYHYLLLHNVQIFFWSHCNMVLKIIHSSIEPSCR